MKAKQRNLRRNLEKQEAKKERIMVQETKRRG